MLANFCGHGLVSWESRPMKSLNHDTRHFSRHDSDDKKWQTINVHTLRCCLRLWLRNNIKSGPYIWVRRWLGLLICWSCICFKVNWSAYFGAQLHVSTGLSCKQTVGQSQLGILGSWAIFSSRIERKCSTWTIKSDDFGGRQIRPIFAWQTTDFCWPSLLADEIDQLYRSSDISLSSLQLSDKILHLPLTPVPITAKQSLQSAGMQGLTSIYSNAAGFLPRRKIHLWPENKSHAGTINSQLLAF